MIETPSVVPRRTGCYPDRHVVHAFWFENVARHAHRSHLGVAVACASTSNGTFLGQRHAVDLPCGSSSVATRDASDRLLPFHVLVPAPAPRRLSLRRALARFATEEIA
jgi:hypothetical protein